jgi:hypothetical protein
MELCYLKVYASLLVTGDSVNRWEEKKTVISLYSERSFKVLEAHRHLRKDHGGYTNLVFFLFIVVIHSRSDPFKSSISQLKFETTYIYVKIYSIA